MGGCALYTYSTYLLQLGSKSTYSEKKGFKKYFAFGIFKDTKHFELLHRLYGATDEI